MSVVREKVYADILSVFHQWEFLILRIQVLLLWERVYMSLVFNIFIHLLFWVVALAPQSSLFILCVCLSIGILCDLLRNLLSRILVDPNKPPGSFSELVAVALDRGYILSIEELSLWIAHIFYHLISLVNGLAPCRRRRPLLFFLITSSVSVACIWLGAYLPGLVVSYITLNIFLILPVMLHHHVGSRIWNTIQPILRRIEEEFDKHPLETVDDRLAGEAEFYQPIIAAATASHPELLSNENDDGFLSDTFLFPSTRRRTSSSEELDTSEAAFIKQFAPKMSNEEIDRVFSDVLTDGSTRALPSPALSRLPTVAASTSDPTTMFDEYATDDELDIPFNHTEDSFTESTYSSNWENTVNDYVFVPKKEEDTS